MPDVYLHFSPDMQVQEYQHEDVEPVLRGHLLDTTRGFFVHEYRQQYVDARTWPELEFRDGITYTTLEAYYELDMFNCAHPTLHDEHEGNDDGIIGQEEMIVPTWWNGALVHHALLPDYQYQTRLAARVMWRRRRFRDFNEHQGYIRFNPAIGLRREEPIVYEHSESESSNPWDEISVTETVDTNTTISRQSITTDSDPSMNQHSRGTYPVDDDLLGTDIRTIVCPDCGKRYSIYRYDARRFTTRISRPTPMPWRFFDMMSVNSHFQYGFYRDETDSLEFNDNVDIICDECHQVAVATISRSFGRYEWWVVLSNFLFITYPPVFPGQFMPPAQESFGLPYGSVDVLCAQFVKEMRFSYDRLGVFPDKPAYWIWLRRIWRDKNVNNAHTVQVPNDINLGMIREGWHDPDGNTIALGM